MRVVGGVTIIDAGQHRAASEPVYPLLLAGPAAARGQVVWHYQQHYTGLVRLGALLTGDQGVAEDLVHDAFERLYRHSDRLRDESRVLPYLRTTVVNLARGRHRRHLVALRHPQPAERPDRSAEDVALGRSSRPAVVDALAQLPARQRECLVLRHWLRMTEGEIAATLGVSVGSVRTHTHRAHQTMHRLLDTKGLR